MGKTLQSVPVHQRHFGLMFQEYALFPHLTVEQNAAFGLRMHNLPVGGGENPHPRRPGAGENAGLR